MSKSNDSDICISGIGVTASIGQGKASFTDALLSGSHSFSRLKRDGRSKSISSEPESGRISFLGAEISDLQIPDEIDRGKLRTASLSSHVAVATLGEAWSEARLSEIEPARIGLVVGGSNFQQREVYLAHEKYRDTPHYLRPTYGLSFLDTDLCGLCTELFGIKGFAYTVGGASASGLVSVLQAAQAIESGQVDACIALGALMDISFWECQGLRTLGAMGSDRFSNAPDLACRPFDQSRDGFIFGESCGALVLQRSNALSESSLEPYARLSAWSMQMDCNRNPNPSLNGECAVIQAVLEKAGLPARKVDYVNPHGTGSNIGDETELQALKRCGLTHARLNATKSIIGHGLSSAGAVELIATLLQMRSGKLHPSRNLIDPIDSSFNWVKAQAVDQVVTNAIKLSMGFGGVNSAVCLSSY